MAESFTENGACISHTEVDPEVEVTLKEEDVRVACAYRAGLEKKGKSCCSHHTMIQRILSSGVKHKNSSCPSGKFDAGGEMGNIRREFVGVFYFCFIFYLFVCFLFFVVVVVLFFVFFGGRALHQNVYRIVRNINTL